jgi:hypothetical protein
MTPSGGLAPRALCILALPRTIWISGANGRCSFRYWICFSWLGRTLGWSLGGSTVSTYVSYHFRFSFSYLLNFVVVGEDYAWCSASPTPSPARVLWSHPSQSFSVDAFLAVSRHLSYSLHLSHGSSHRQTQQRCLQPTSRLSWVVRL